MLSSSKVEYMGLIMRKPVLCEQQRCRSACASAQSDQHLCCSLPKKYNICSFYICNFTNLGFFCSWTGWFELYLSQTPQNRFSRDEAHIRYFDRFCSPDSVVRNSSLDFMLRFPGSSVFVLGTDHLIFMMGCLEDFSDTFSSMRTKFCQKKHSGRG